MNLKLSLFSILLMASCSKNTQVYAPLGGLNQEDLSISQQRSKQLNLIEREQIKDWIAQQNQKFYSTQLNYWISTPNMEQRNRKQDGEMISYQYELYDFEMSPFYQQPTIKENAVFGKFSELEAIENALRYLDKGEEATLLVPSVLAYGTYGDEKEIPYDMPLIIKLKILK